MSLEHLEELTRKLGEHPKTESDLRLAETYAVKPKFYGSTYCCQCQMHKPVSEFTWEPDGTVVGS